MQDTRRHILDILRELGPATVDEIAAQLCKRRGQITAVTVRHHLSRLQQDRLVTEPELLHRNAPGRPQHRYALTERAHEQFPSNYQSLSTHLLSALRQQLPANSVNVILEGVATRMAEDARVPEGTLCERLDVVVEYLTQQGYDAYWEPGPEGYILHTSNCPYHQIAQDNMTLCEMDMRLVAKLLGVVPRLMSRVSSGASTCSYMVPAHPHEA